MLLRRRSVFELPLLVRLVSVILSIRGVQQVDFCMTVPSGGLNKSLVAAGIQACIGAMTLVNVHVIISSAFSSKRFRTAFILAGKWARVGRRMPFQRLLVLEHFATIFKQTYQAGLVWRLCVRNGGWRINSCNTNRDACGRCAASCTTGTGMFRRPACSCPARVLKDSCTSKTRAASMRCTTALYCSQRLHFPTSAQALEVEGCVTVTYPHVKVCAKMNVDCVSLYCAQCQHQYCLLQHWYQQ